MREKQELNLEEKMEIMVNAVGSAFGVLDTALKQMVELAETLPIEKQKKVSRAIECILGHIEGSLTDARYALKPVSNSSKDYSV